ncbi:hypothetical protein SAMN05421687_10817 [Salimicrobium flavidum]|uniref:Uncharacterized protein n=1 Tax=Salimicrobium flavidum TaxID=570947 RepID=A0A1N7JX92_9BACI|nr:hypothetical protein SAMN05421687_10817 [Salimicrobium flavidum]
MKHESAEAYLRWEKEQILREMTGLGRFQIEYCELLPDNDRHITLRDHTATDPEQATRIYAYSTIPYEDDSDVQDFFIRHKRIIDEGIYDDLPEG